MRNLRRSRGQKLEGRGIAKRKEKIVADQEVTEVTTEDIEALPRTEASAARIIGDTIDPGRGLLGSIEVRSVCIETDHLEGKVRDHQI